MVVVVETVWSSVALASNSLEGAATSPIAATLPEQDSTKTETLGWWEGGSRRNTEYNTAIKHDDGTQEEQDDTVSKVLKSLNHLDILQHLQENKIAQGPVGSEGGRKADHLEGLRRDEEKVTQEIEEEEEKGRLFFTGLTGNNNQEITITVGNMWSMVMWVILLVALIKFLIQIVTGKSYDYWGRWATSA